VDAHATGLVQGTPAADRLLAQYDRGRFRRPAICSRWRSRVNQALPPVKPDERFVRALYDEMGTADLPSPACRAHRHLQRVRSLLPV
jgi:hypothetical protein